MKFLKPTFIFLSLFLCSLLSAQETQFEINLSTKLDSNKVEKKDIKVRVKKFAEDFIQPIMRGEAYDIEITDIDLMVNYQNENPVKCGFTGYHANMNGKMHQARGVGWYCHDKSSYTYMYDHGEIFDDEESRIVNPFDSAIRQYNLNKDRSVIISFQIKLKREFQESLLKFLEDETTGKDVLSYRNLPARTSAEGNASEYIKCMGDHIMQCSGTLGRAGGLNGLTGNLSTKAMLQEPNYVINFIDRRLEKVTFFNLKNYRSELIRSRKHRFLTNLCMNLRHDDYKEEYSFSKGYFNQKHTQFNDLSIILKNKNGDAIDEIIINLHQPADRFKTTGGSGVDQSTFGLRKESDFIFSHNYGSNALNARSSDYLGNRNIMGHLIDDNRKAYYSGRCSVPGLSSDKPAFSIISNYEYHLVLQLDQETLKEVNSAKINYVPPQSSIELMNVSKF